MTAFLPRALRALAPAAILTAGLLGGAPAFAIDIQRVVSPGGIEAWLVAENSLPIVSMAFSFTGGSAQDPAGNGGTANILTAMLDEGAGDLDGPAFQAILDNDSIRLGFDTSRETISGSVRTLTANEDEAFRLLKLSLTAPRFDKEPLERIRAQVIANLKRAQKNPDSQAGEAFAKAEFGDHPYGRPGAGTLDSVPTITPDDLRSVLKNTMTRGNLKISVVGDIDAKQLAAVLDQVFGALPATPNLMPVPDVAFGKGTRIDFASPAPQANIRFGNAGLLRKDPDFYAATVANYIFGSGSDSRLYAEIREKRGYAYSVSTGLSYFDHAAAMIGGTATRADRAEETLSLIKQEMKRFVTDGATQKELDDAKSFLIGSYALRFTDSGSISRQLLAIQQDDMGIDYINQRNGLIAAVTLADVNRVAKRIYDPDNLIITMVGASSTPVAGTPPIPAAQPVGAAPAPVPGGALR